MSSKKDDYMLPDLNFSNEDLQTASEMIDIIEEALAYDYPNDAKLGKKVRKLIQEAEKNSYQRPENAYPTPTTGG